MVRQRIAVIGGVAAGPAAAAHAHRVDPDAEVVLFEKGPHISYGACEIPYYVSDRIESADELVVYSPGDFEQEKGVEVRIQHTVTDIRPEKNRLVYRVASTGRSQEERFDKFILATGARADRPDIAGADAVNCFAVRTLEDAIDIKNYVTSRRVRHAVILGGGYIGVEMAEAMVNLKIRVTLLEPGDGVLHRYVSEPLREIVKEALRDHGVQIRDERAIRFDVGSQGAITSIGTDRGETIGCQLVVAAIGTYPDASLAPRAGLKLTASGAIHVDDTMRTSAPNVWACGDCVEVRHVVSDRPVYLPLSQTAFRTARVAAQNAARQGRGRPARFPGATGASAVKVFGVEVARVGLSLDEAVTAGFDAFAESVEGWSRVKSYPGAERLHIELVVERSTGRLLGGAIVGREGAAMRANALVPLVWDKWAVQSIRDLDLVYTPPVAPSIDPVLVAANRAAARIESANTTLRR